MTTPLVTNAGAKEIILVRLADSRSVSATDAIPAKSCSFNERGSDADRAGRVAGDAAETRLRDSAASIPALEIRLSLHAITGDENGC